MQQRGKPARQFGQAIVEFTLVIPIILAIVLGTLDLGRAVYAFIALQHGVRDAARYGTIYSSSSVPTATTIQNYVRSSAAGPTMASNSINVISYLCSTGNTSCGSQYTCTSGCSMPSGNMLRVTATYSFVAITPFVPSITLYAEASMQVE